MYRENGIVQLTHSFRLSYLTSMERLKMEAGEYWGINASKYELRYLQMKKQEERNKDQGEMKLKSLSKYSDLTVDKCLEVIKLRTAIFCMIKQNSKLLKMGNKEAKEAKVESKAIDFKQIRYNEDLIEREKVLGMYHGLNVI